jgi:steroid delta-isomerase-like uncharacterized protein
MNATNEVNVELARRWFEEVWNERRPEAVDEILTPECIGHTDSGDMVGGQAFIENIYRPFLGAFPDLNITVEDMVSQADKVAVRWRAEGTHCGEGLGCPPSQRPVMIRGITWMKFQDGKMVEAWDCWNVGGLMQQLMAAA